MPRISEFYGIVIWMYWSDHLPPHFHAEFSGHWAELTIADGRLLNGFLPARALRLVREWLEMHDSDLQDRWEQARRHDPLDPIDPLP